MSVKRFAFRGFYGDASFDECEDGDYVLHSDYAALESRLRELTEWRPMETATRDGRPLLLWVDTDDGGEPMILYRDKDGHWLYENEPTFCHPFYLNPTHWLPLPEGPK